MIKVLTFDCDGVMFDSEKANRAFYNQILAHFGMPAMTDEQFAHAQMHTVDQALASLFPDPGLYAEAQKYRKQTGYRPFIPCMEMDPELTGVLEHFKPCLFLAVATNRTDTMDSVLEVHGISNYFDLVVTAVDVENPKPHPESLVRILEHFSVKPDEMLYVGDSPLDSAAAETAGVRFAACRNPSIKADYYIRSLSELKQLAGKENDRQVL